LEGANLIGTHLERAWLDGAHLEKAFLVGAHEQAPATLRPGGRLPFPVLSLAETTERVQVVVSWKDEAGPHQESFTVRLPWVHRILIRDRRLSAVLSGLCADRGTP
jgi:hypothetical protein